MNRIHDRSVIELIEKLEERRISRRTFVKRATAAGVSMSLIGPVLAACGGGPEQQGGGGGGGGGGDLVVASTSTPASLDKEFEVGFTSQQAFQNVYGTPLMWKLQPDQENKQLLVPVFDEDPEPWLVEEWELSEDKKSVTFNLKQGVKSEYGNELTSADPVWTLHRGANLKAISAFFAGVIGWQPLGEDAIEAIDKYTVRYTTAKTNPILVRVFANMYMYWWDSKEAKKHATADDPWAAKWLANHSCGFGPYRVTEFTPSQQVVFEKNPNYPYPVKNKRVVYKEVPNSANRLALLLSGSVNVAENLSALDLEKARANDKIAVYDFPSNWQQMLEMNLKKPPFDKREVRQAMAYATPYDDIIETVFQGRGRQMTSPVPFIYPLSSEQEPYTLDLDRAKQLLAAGGVPNGFDTTISFDAARTDQEQMSVLIQSSLAKIGVRAKLAKLPTSSYTDALNKRQLEFFWWQDMPIQPDPGYALFLYYHGKSFTAYSNYNNPRVNQLIDGITSTYDEQKRKQMADEAQRLIWEDAPHIWAAWPGWHLATRADVSGVNWQPANNMRFELVAT